MPEGSLISKCIYIFKPLIGEIGIQLLSNHNPFQKLVLIQKLCHLKLQ